MAITTEQRTQLIELYVAIAGRAPDASGLGYWANEMETKGYSIAEIAAFMYDTDDAKALYPRYLTSEEVATAFYENVLGRTPDAEGLAYWAAKLNENGVVQTMQDMIYAVKVYDGEDPAGLTSKQLFADKLALSEQLAVVRQSDDLSVASTSFEQLEAGVSLEDVLANLGSGSEYVLTNGTDVATANVFEAGRVYTPGGTDQINSLNDDDKLTGTGNNPTLNLTFVDNADTGATVIAPTLNGIETVNVDVVGTLGKTLDLQDATGIDTLNVSRINNTNYVTQNIVNSVENLSINNSNAPGNNVTFVHLASALNGTDDSTTLSLNNAQVGTLRVDAGTGAATTAGVGYETINLVSARSANNVATLSVEDIETLNITGDQNLTIGAFANAGGSLSSIDASALEGNLDINLNGVLSATQDGTSGTNIALSTVTGAGDDTIRITNDTIGTTDSIDAGDGNDTLALQANTTNNFTPATTGAALVTGVENVTVTHTTDGAATADTLTLDLARIEGDQATRLFNNGDATDTLTTFVLNNASAGDAANISIQHSSTGNNGLLNNRINVDVATGVDTVGVAIEEGNNNDARFNFQLSADSDNIAANATNAVTNITLADNDSESNTVSLTQAGRHTGTISVTGGTAGTFLNLDATTGGGAAVSGYGHVLTGAAGDATTAAAAAAETRDTAVDRVFTAGLVGDQVLLASNINASDFVGNFEGRLGLSNTNAQLGSGDDTLIFADRAGISAATAGLTIQDTVSGGAGYDTIILDGAAAAITLGASEWTNLSGVDEVRVAGVTGGTYTLRLTDQLVTQADAGNRIVIVNNDGDLTANTENALTVDTRALAATSSVTFTGANGDGSFTLGARNAQTVILDDVTANGNNILDGGDVNVVSEYVANGRNVAGGAGAVFATQAAADAQYAIDVAAGFEGNDNILQIFNTAEVTVGDLANTQNFSTINFTNDQAAVQTLNLTLNDAAVDALVDASHTATANQVETLTITATDNAVVPLAFSVLNVQAGTVGAQFSLNVTGAGGADTIVGGAGADTITGGAGADTLTGGLGADTFAYASTTIAGLTAEGGDSITDFLSGTDIISFADLSGDVGFTVGTATVAGETLLASTGNAGTADINFVSGAGAVALSAESTLVFDTTTRVLSFDADGTGAGAAVAIATVGVGQTIIAGDIVIA